VDQLKLIIKVLGPPSDDDLSFINSSKARAYIRALPQQEVSRAPTANIAGGGSHRSSTGFHHMQIQQGGAASRLLLRYVMFNTPDHLADMLRALC
jgi:hypothetical protein